MSPEYPPLPGPPPQVFSPEHVMRWEQELQNLAITDWILKKAERLEFPVETTRRECDALCRVFTRLVAEERGQQSPNPMPLA